MVKLDFIIFINPRLFPSSQKSLKFLSKISPPDIAVPTNDIVLYSHSDQLRIIPYLSPNSDPMCYPILYPTGEPGWSTGLLHVAEHATEKRNKVTILQFYAYKWAIRHGFNPLHHAGYLAQMKMIDDWIKVDKSHIDYIKKQHSRLRLETLHGLHDHVHSRNSNANVANSPSSIGPQSQSNDIIDQVDTPSTIATNQYLPTSAVPTTPPPLNSSTTHPNSPHNIVDPPASPLGFGNLTEPTFDIGTQVILPSSFMGSPRNMAEAYHDAMAVIRVLGHPDVFTTMTCNENWPEICDNLKSGQQSSDQT